MPMEKKIIIVCEGKNDVSYLNALMSRSLWPAVRDWLDASGYYDLFVAAQDFREDHPQFAAALAAARTRFSLPDSEIAAILADAVAT